MSTNATARQRRPEDAANVQAALGSAITALDRVERARSTPAISRQPPAPASPAAPALTGDSRRSAILDLPEARGRGPASEHLAFATDVSVSEARTILGRAAVDPDEDATVEAARVMAAHGGARTAPRADGWLARRMGEQNAVETQRAAPEPASHQSAASVEAEAAAIVAAHHKHARKV